jgi:hypothetical protein
MAKPAISGSSASFLVEMQAGQEIKRRDSFFGRAYVEDAGKVGEVVSHSTSRNEKARPDGRADWKMRVEERQSLTGDLRPNLSLCMGLQELAVVAFARRAPAADGQRVGMQCPTDGDTQHRE